MSTANESYLGWSNFETWSTATWLDVQGVANEMRQFARNLASWRDCEPEYVRAVIADRIRDRVIGGNPLTGDASLYHYLLNGALEVVDWHEIADNWLEGES